MWRITTSAITAIAVLAWTPSAHAVERVKLRGNGGRIGGVVDRVIERPGSEGGTSTPAGTPSPLPPAPVVTRTREYVAYDYSNSGGGQLRYVFDDERDYCDYGSASVTCFGPRPEPGEPGPRRVAPPVTPEDIVERTLVNAKLPSPRPNIDPGYAVTGMRAYLETGDRRTHRFDAIPTVLGPLQITATSTYTVDWGDGTVTGPHQTTGGKYPDGTISHVYTDTGTVDVTVSQTWTARWWLAGRSGTVGGLRSSGTIEDFAVQEVQAVRTH
jgi:hypothetical protein